MSESSSPHRIIITGATSIVGQFLLPRLAAAGNEVYAISRKNSSNLVTIHIKVASEHDVGTAFSVFFQYAGNAMDVEKDTQKTNPGKYVATDPAEESLEHSKGGCQPA